jgi:hypothetical protein
MIKKLLDALRVLPVTVIVPVVPVASSAITERLLTKTKTKQQHGQVHPQQTKTITMSDNTEPIDLSNMEVSCVNHIVDNSNDTYDDDQCCQIIKKPKKSTNNLDGTRHSWVKVTDTVDGVTTYPFLQDKNNFKDKVFVKYLSAYHPYKAPHGKTMEQWKNVLSEMMKEQDDDGKSIYTKGLQIRTLKDRFNQYITFVKNHQNNVPFRSGCDDEEECPLLDGLEQIYEDYNSFLSIKDNTKKETIEKKNNDREAAEEIRDAALGKLRKKLSDTTSDEDGDDGKKTPPSKTSATKTMKSLNDFTDVISVREDRLLLKEKNRAKALELKEKEIENKQKNDEATRQLLMALANKLA